MWAVFFGRFVALLRIFAGPLAGVLHMPYWKFLIANVLGGILWAGGTTAVIYYVGVVAESWLKRFSWLGLVAGRAHRRSPRCWSSSARRRRSRRSERPSGDGRTGPGDRLSGCALYGAQPRFGARGTARPVTAGLQPATNLSPRVPPGAPSPAPRTASPFSEMPSRSSSVSSRFTLAGTPATSEPGRHPHPLRDQGLRGDQ